MPPRLDLRLSPNSTQRSLESLKQGRSTDTGAMSSAILNSNPTQSLRETTSINRYVNIGSQTKATVVEYTCIA